MADLLIRAVRWSRGGPMALALVAIAATACAPAPPVAVERSMLTPPTSERPDEPDDLDEPAEPDDEAQLDEPDDEAQLDEAGLDQDVLDSLDELDEPEPRLEPDEEESEAVVHDRLQIDDVVWSVPDDNDRWDLDRDGDADTVARNPWQMIDERLPTGDRLGEPWDSSYRSTSIVGGGSIVAHANTDCDGFDLLTGLNNEYHGIQSWEGDGETIRAFVVALDDSIQAAGIAGMLGDLPTTCPTIGADPDGTRFETFRALPLPTAHDSLDSVLLRSPDGTAVRVVARSHGALLHVVTLTNWIEQEPSERAVTDFATIVDSVVASTPGAEPAVETSTNGLAQALPTGDDVGLRWEAPFVAEATYGTDGGRATCDARAAFGAVEDRMEVGAATSYDADVYAAVSLGEFGSAGEAADVMSDMLQLSACPAPEGFELLIIGHDIVIDASGHQAVPFSYDDETLAGGVMDAVTLTVGPYVAVIAVFAFPDVFVSEGDSGDPATLRRQLQLLVDHTVRELEALS